jgi:Cysteine-rich secretory protein family
MSLRAAILFVALAAARCLAADSSAVELSIRAATNDFRASEKVSALGTDPRLAKAAQEFANFMARSAKYGHDADGRTPALRATAAGYDHCIVSENIAYQESSVELNAEELARALMDGWKNSPGHRKNMLDADVTQFGVGVARASNGRNYAVQLFAKPSTEMTTFEIRNSSAGVFNYRFGETAYSLPVGTKRSHGFCRAANLVVEGAQTVTPLAGDKFTVVGEAGKARVLRGSVAPGSVE